jgi:hypothetical protein
MAFRIYKQHTRQVATEELLDIGGHYGNSFYDLY